MCCYSFCYKSGVSSHQICLPVIFMPELHECDSYHFHIWHTNLVIVTVSEELFPCGVLKKTPLWRKCKLGQEVCTLGLLCSRLQEIQKGHITVTNTGENFKKFHAYITKTRHKLLDTKKKVLCFQARYFWMDALLQRSVMRLRQMHTGVQNQTWCLNSRNND